MDFKIKTVTRDKEEHYKVIKRSFQEEMTTINIYADIIGPPQYIRQVLTTIEGNIENSTI